MLLTPPNGFEVLPIVSKLLNKLTVTEHAKLSNLSKSYISQVRHGKYPPSRKLFLAVQAHYGEASKSKGLSVSRAIDMFFESRREGLSCRTIEFYSCYLAKVIHVLGLARFGERTELLLSDWLSQYEVNGRLWDLNTWGIVEMLQRLRIKTGLPCNPHTFRRIFASIFAKRGVDSLHIMRLGRWKSIQMVEIYTRSVRFADSLKFDNGVLS